MPNGNDTLPMYRIGGQYRRVDNQLHCYDKQYQPTSHGEEQRYASPTTGKCRRLIVQAVHSNLQLIGGNEVSVTGHAPRVRKLSIWLVTHLPLFNPENIPLWLWRWAKFTLALIWLPSFFAPKYTGSYPPYLSRYHGQLSAARSPREYSLRTERLGVEPVHHITHSTHPRRLVIYDPARSWHICSDENIIKKQRYVAISYRGEDIVSQDVRDETVRLGLQEAFITQIETTLTSLHETAYWIDLKSIDKKDSPGEINEDVYRMADVYRGAQFTLIMLCPSGESTEEIAWSRYGERLWTFPEALLSKELRFKFGAGKVTSITLHQLANRAYANLAEESAIINAYGLRDPLERLERLSLLKSALWRRTSGSLQRLQENTDAKSCAKAERVYALMGFFEHRIHPDIQETELQAFVRLSMANDNDRIVERMVSLLPPKIPDTTRWHAEEDEWGSNLWDIEPQIQVVGTTEDHAIILGGCRAAAIRWKDFPSVSFATQRPYNRLFADYFPHFAWVFLGLGIAFKVHFVHHVALIHFIVAATLLLIAPMMKAYGTSGLVVQAQPWLIGVKGLISAEEAAVHLYGGAIGALPRICYSPSGTPLARARKGQFRGGDPEQLAALRSETNSDLYSLVDTVSATIYYFRAARPPTVCLFTGMESGMGRFVLCSERCARNELHKETVIRMPWYVSQAMPACDWIALG